MTPVQSDSVDCIDEEIPGSTLAYYRTAQRMFHLEFHKSPAPQGCTE
jgi:ubiquitin-protein ligase